MYRVTFIPYHHYADTRSWTARDLPSINDRTASFITIDGLRVMICGGSVVAEELVCARCSNKPIVTKHPNQPDTITPCPECGK